MAVTWRKPDNVVKQKKVNPSVKKKLKAIAAAKTIAEATGVPYVPPNKRRDIKRKRDEFDDGAGVEGEAGLGRRPKKQAKGGKKGSRNVSAASAGDHAAAATNDSGPPAAATPVKDMPLQDLAFVDTAGSGPVKIGKDGRPKPPKVKVNRKVKLMPKAERKELKRLKKMGLARGTTAASIMAAREPEKKEDTRKVRKQRRLLRKKGLFKELAEFEAKVAADKEAKRLKEAEEAAAPGAAAETDGQIEAVDDTAVTVSSGNVVAELKMEPMVQKKTESLGDTAVETVSAVTTEFISVLEADETEPQPTKKKSKKDKKEKAEKKEKKEKNEKKSKKSKAKDATSETGAVTNGKIAASQHQNDAEAEPQASEAAAAEEADEAFTASTRSRAPLPDPVVPPAKDHRFIVFVGNLPFTATRETIAHHFKAVHPTNVRLMTEKETGKSRGFAFVEFDRYDYMNSCLQKYHHSHFAPGTDESRRINVELTVGGGGSKDERKSKIKHKNEKLRHEQFRRRERAKDEEYRIKIEDKAAATAAAEGGADNADGKKDKKSSKKGGQAVEAPVETNGVHPSRMGRVRQ